MPETHINGYFAALDEAAAEVVAANAKWNAAKAALEVKKKQVGWKEPTQIQEPVSQESKPVESSSSKDNKDSKSKK